MIEERRFGVSGRGAVYALLGVLLGAFILPPAKAGLPLAHQPLRKAENIGHLMAQWQFLSVTDPQGHQRDVLLLSNTLPDKGHIAAKDQAISISFENIAFSLKIMAEPNRQATAVLKIKRSRFSCHKGILKLYFTNGKFLSFYPKNCTEAQEVEAVLASAEEERKLAFFMRKYVPVFVVQNNLMLKLSHQENAALKKFRHVLSAPS